jgi:radical SAM protein with 4Fe4S-binding SPASM domain
LSYGNTFDLRKGSFEEGWENFLYQIRQTKISKQTKCNTCEIRSMCGMCPANGELECLDAETPVDFLCRVAHLRAYCFGITVAPHGECEYCTGGESFAAMMETVERIIRKSECGSRKSECGMRKVEFKNDVKDTRESIFWK